MSVTATESNALSQLSQVTDGIISPGQKWFALDYNVLDGTFHPVDTTQEIGWWGATLSDSSGNLASVPTITVPLTTSGTISVQSVSVSGDSARDEYPVNFTITFLSSGTTVDTINVAGNTQVTWVQYLSAPVQADTLKVAVNTINNPSRILRMTESNIGFTLVRSDIFKPKLDEIKTKLGLVIQSQDSLSVKTVDADHEAVDTLLVKTDTKGILTNIHTVMNADVRQTFAQVTITYTDPFNDDSLQIAAISTGQYTSTAQLADNITTAEYKWLCLDNNVLDGSFHPLPNANEYSVGWWDTNLSNPDGTLSTQPVLTVTFSARAVTQLKVVGDNMLNQYPTAFTYNLYDTNNNILLTKVVTGNTLVDWEFTPTTPILNVVKAVLTIQAINQGGVVTKLTELFSSVIQTYDGDALYSINLIEETGYYTGTLPIGNVSSNEVTILLDNSDKRFSVNNKQSTLYGLLKRNRRVDVSIGAMIGNTLEWTPLGTFWTTSWNVQKNSLSATLVARDRLELLRLTNFETSLVYQNYTITQLFELVFQDAGLTSAQYNIDSTLSNYTVAWAWFDQMSHRDAVQRIAGCNVIEVFCDRNDVIQVNYGITVGPTVIDTFDDDINVIDTKSPTTVDTQINYVQVTATQWVQNNTVQTLYQDTNTVAVPGGGTNTQTYLYTQVPALTSQAPVITADAGIAVSSYSAYNWGMVVTYSNSSGSSANVTAVTINGTILQQGSQQTLTAQDPASIKQDGTITFTLEHDFLQDTTAAQNLANEILSLYGQASLDITLDTVGNAALRLGDRVQVNDSDTGDQTQYTVTRQNLTWAGYLSGTVDGKKI